jgi:hypothetical protein
VVALDSLLRIEPNSRFQFRKSVFYSHRKTGLHVPYTSDILHGVSVVVVTEYLSTGLDTLTAPLITMGVSTEV